MFKSLTEGENKFRNIRLFNIFMGIVHLVQGILMLIIANDFCITVTTDFLKSQGSPSAGNFVIFNVKEGLVDIRIGAAIALFLLISAIAHFLISMPGIFSWYVENLKQGVNYARWYEYAFSSSVMIVVIALLVGFTDAPGLVLLFSINGFMNIFGLLMEKFNYGLDKVEWTHFIYGVIAGIIPWIIIAWYFISAVKGYVPGEGGNPIPDFVYLILISIFLFFNIFAVNMFLQYKKIGPWKNYLFGEVMYIILSLVAKSALAWQVFSGTLRGN